MLAVVTALAVIACNGEDTLPPPGTPDLSGLPTPPPHLLQAPTPRPTRESPASFRTIPRQQSCKGVWEVTEAPDGVRYWACTDERHVNFFDADIADLGGAYADLRCFGYDTVWVGYRAPVPAPIKVVKCDKR